jgi:hypothetical protein
MYTYSYVLRVIYVGHATGLWATANVGDRLANVLLPVGDIFNPNMQATRAEHVTWWQ